MTGESERARAALAETAIADVNRRFMDHFERGDAAGLAELYTEGGQLLPPGSDVVTGKEAVRPFWQAVMDMGIKRAKLETVELETYGDAAVEVGRYTLSGETGVRNSILIAALVNWNEQGPRGQVFDSSTGFLLPNGAMRSPDAAWVKRERWAQLSEEAREWFVPLCPDLVVELMSKTDRLQPVQEKMEEWRANGCRLGWLIHPAAEQVFIYRPGEQPQRVASFDAVLDGEAVCPGLKLPLDRLR